MSRWPRRPAVYTSILTTFIGSRIKLITQGLTTQRVMPRFNLASACARQPAQCKSVCSSEVLVNRPAPFGPSCGSSSPASLALPPVEMCTTVLDCELGLL